VARHARNILERRNTNGSGGGVGGNSNSYGSIASSLSSSLASGSRKQAITSFTLKGSAPSSEVISTSLPSSSSSWRTRGRRTINRENSALLMPPPPRRTLVYPGDQVMEEEEEVDDGELGNSLDNGIGGTSFLSAASALSNLRGTNTGSTSTSSTMMANTHSMSTMTMQKRQRIRAESYDERKLKQNAIGDNRGDGSGVDPTLEMELRHPSLSLSSAGGVLPPRPTPSRSIMANTNTSVEAVVTRGRSASLSLLANCATIQEAEDPQVEEEEEEENDDQEMFQMDE